MKWTEDLDNQLSNLISLGKKHSEIAEELNLTTKSVSSRCFRLGLKIISKKEFTCIECSETFLDYINSNRKFCSKSCSCSNSNSNRNLSDDTKEKIRQSRVGKKHTKETIDKISGDKNGSWIDGRSKYKSTKKVKKIKEARYCRNCKEVEISKKYKIICDGCKFNYYKLYRPLCEFNFDIKDFIDKFDYNLIIEHGWYRPINRGNNLNGVSRDHLYSVKDGYLNKVDPSIISHPANCKLVLHKDNMIKNSKSSITLDDLIDRINKW